MKPVKLFYFVLVFLLLMVLACSSGLPLSFLAPTTPTPEPAINFEVTIITPTATPAPAAAGLNTGPVLSATITGTRPISETALQAQSALITTTVPVTASVSPEIADSALPGSSPAATPQPQALTTTTTVSQTAAITTTAAPQAVSAPGILILLEPAQDFKLQPGINELEFKWRWAEGKSCQPAEGFGYEVRIWPAITGYGPMGVTDAVKDQKDFFCDPKSNVASYRVVNLKGTPGVAEVTSGKFLWDVAYIQLDPYNPVFSAIPRLFEIP
jgi:hypothetical protein